MISSLFLHIGIKNAHFIKICTVSHFISIVRPNLLLYCLLRMCLNTKLSSSQIQSDIIPTLMLLSTLTVITKLFKLNWESISQSFPNIPDKVLYQNLQQRHKVKLTNPEYNWKHHTFPISSHYAACTLCEYRRLSLLS